ncbi:MAG: hypothetical protein N7Q72_02145, partial [Spiroplasma sp. Tabriz.8]|nr:hypothetical protein [Candidatus Regiella insecticola]MCZ8632045.1 hypothetical protein [Spiroplasma sp. Tabriz.8]
FILFFNLYIFFKSIILYINEICSNNFFYILFDNYKRENLLLLLLLLLLLVRRDNKDIRHYLK